MLGVLLGGLVSLWTSDSTPTVVAGQDVGTDARPSSDVFRGSQPPTGRGGADERPTATTTSRPAGGTGSPAATVPPQPPTAAAAPESAGAGASSRAGTPPAGPTAAAAPAPGPVAGAGGRLSWAPPAGYLGYPVHEVSSADSLTVIDGRGGDVRVELSRSHSVGPVTITNCRNAVLIGGHITVLPSSQVDGADQRAIYVRDCTGTVHIEGVQIEGDVAGSEADGIAANAPEAVLQIENVRIEGMRGGYDTNHADVFQPWGGVRAFRIDRLSGSTNYQGLHIFETLGAIGAGTIRNTNIASSEVRPVDKGGYYIWMDCSDGYPLELNNVYIAGRKERPFGQSIWPPVSDPSCPAMINDGLATWPGNPSLSGGVREGRPPSGDFVPSGSVGLRYQSPGYR